MKTEIKNQIGGENIMQNNIENSRNDETKNDNKKLEGSNAMMNETENSCNNAATNSKEGKIKKYKEHMEMYIASIIAELINTLIYEGNYYAIISWYFDMKEENNQKAIKLLGTFSSELFNIVDDAKSNLEELGNELRENNEEWNSERTIKFINIFVRLPKQLKETIDNLLKAIEKDDINHIINLHVLKERLYFTLKFCEFRSSCIVENIEIP